MKFTRNGVSVEMTVAEAREAGLISMFIKDMAVIAPADQEVQPEQIAQPTVKKSILATIKDVTASNPDDVDTLAEKYGTAFNFYSSLLVGEKVVTFFRVRNNALANGSYRTRMRSAANTRGYKHNSRKVRDDGDFLVYEAVFTKLG